MRAEAAPTAQRFGAAAEVLLVSGLQQPPQHRLQDSPVAVVLQLDWRIDSAGRQKLDRAAFLVGDGYLHLLAGHQVVVDVDLEGAKTRQSQAAAVLAALEDERENAHADQVAAVDTLEA